VAKASNAIEKEGVMMTVDDECLAVTEEYLKTTASAAQACVCIFQYYNEH
jgi:hypothetical protein